MTIEADTGQSWSQVAARAFDFRRAWRRLLEAEPASPALVFNHADPLVLSLLVDLLEVDHIVTASSVMAARLNAAFASARPAAAIRCSPQPDGRPHLLLLGVDDVPDLGATALRDAAMPVLYGIGGGLPLTAGLARLPGARLLLLSAHSPALWQCGLALITTDETRASGEMLAEKVARSMRGEWIDPLVLFEEVQRLSAKLRQVGMVSDHGGDPTERVARLESELAELKQAALVRQHLLLLDGPKRSGRGFA